MTGSLLKPRRISFHLFFWPVIRWPKRCDHDLPHRLRPAHRLSQIYPNDTADFRLVVVSSHAAGAIAIRGPIAFSILFFSSLISSPETMKSPPPRVPPVRTASPMPPPPPIPSFGWLLRQTIEQRPFKAGAPPVSQFSDGRHFGAPNKGIKLSAREPGRRTPPLGS